jgi:LysM repeat protein
MLRRGIEGIVGVALMAALVALLLPAVAQAQEEGSSGSTSVVVRPGDTLWSISEQQLGPRATPQRVAREAERIYALNQDRIGPDPNLIFAGQELSLPSAGQKKASAQASAQEAPGAVQGANQTAQKDPAQASPASRSAKSETAQDSKAAAPAKASVQTEKAASPVAERDALLNAPKAKPVPVAKPLSSDGASRSPVAHLLDDVRSTVTSAVTAAVGGLVGIFTEVAKSVPEGRRLLGSALLGMSSILAMILALHVAAELWGPQYAQRRAREQWAREWRRRYYDSLHTYDTSRSGLSANGAASSDSPSDILRKRHIAHIEVAELDVSREWEIGEPLRRAVSSIPLKAGPSRSHALSKAKLLAEEAIATLAFLEQRRQLSAKEHSQARAIRRFLEAVEREQVLFPSYQGRHGLEPSANGSKSQPTPTTNGASHARRTEPGRLTKRSTQKRLPPHSDKRRRCSADTEVHSSEARRLLRKAVLGTRAPQDQRRRSNSGRIYTTRRITGIGGR